MFYAQVIVFLIYFRQLATSAYEQIVGVDTRITECSKCDNVSSKSMNLQGSGSFPTFWPNSQNISTALIGLTGNFKAKRPKVPRLH